jgi:phosphatidylinositol glycan class C protein
MPCRRSHSDNCIAVVHSSFPLPLSTANIQPYEYWSVVRSAAVFLQQISTLIIFVVRAVLFFVRSRHARSLIPSPLWHAPTHLLHFAPTAAQLMLVLVDEKVVTVSFLAVLNAIIAVLVIAWLRLLGPPSLERSLLMPDTVTMICTVGVFAVVLFVLAPVLLTLARSWSDDAAWSSTLLLALLHIAFQNYRDTPTTFAAAGEAPSVPIGFSAIIFAAILLSSRLPSTTHVFVFVSLAIEYFVVYPIARDAVRETSDVADIGLTLVWAAGTTVMLAAMYPFSTMATYYIWGAIGLVFIAPLLLVQSQRFKSELRGPWDIADLRLT